MSAPEGRDRQGHGADASGGRPAAAQGAATASGGTPVPVDTSIDRQSRVAIIAFLIGPVIWVTHFGIVYLVAEAGCTGEGFGFRLFNPPVPTVVTLVATAVASVACLVTTWWAYRRWRTGRPSAHTVGGDQPSDGSPAGAADVGGADPVDAADATLELAGALLSIVSFISVLMVGLPALVLSPC